MKKSIITLFSIFILGFTVHAQTSSLVSVNSKINNFTAVSDKTELLINWTSLNMVQDSYWQVQGSADGKSFTTIGMVMGSDPKNANAYSFKQKIHKLRPGLVYFRVLFIENETAVAVSNLIASTK